MFKEHIKIEIDNEDDFAIKIIDTVRNIESKAEIKQYFNEAKLNLVVLLLILTSFKYAEDTTRKRILVLDDFITSLDIANRTFLMKYIFDNFAEFQIILLTHNINFYNLTQYLINDIYKTNPKWLFANIYEFNNDNKLFLKNSIKKVSDIKQLYETDRRQVEQVGNEIWQKFEVLLYEFSKILMIGAVEDSTKILEYLENSKNIYYNNGKTASELIEDLISIIDRTYPAHVDIKPILKLKIHEYKQNDFPNLQQILKQLKLYRKVTMHPMSHGTVGQTAFTTKEIEQSLDLLERFEARLKAFVDQNVSGI